MVKINRVYTRTGDQGTTRLADGTEVSKNNALIEAYGTVDELSSQLGVVRSLLGLFPLDSEDESQRLNALLLAIQQDLFDLGSLLATPVDSDLKLPSITADHVRELEHRLDALNDALLSKQRKSLAEAAGLGIDAIACMSGVAGTGVTGVLRRAAQMIKDANAAPAEPAVFTP